MTGPPRAAGDTPPGITIGDGYARYRGPVRNCTGHRHAAFQMLLAVDGRVAVEDAAGTVHRGEALLVSPMTHHRMRDAADSVTYYVDPQSALADRWRGRPGITVVGAADRPYPETGTAAGERSDRLDPRLTAAMAIVREDASVTMPELAARLDLSPARLRALAATQLGLPLARWRTWARLAGAAEAIGRGAPPADAALAAGFADQAHLTRSMRALVGLTPGALVAMRPGHARRAV